MHIDSYFSCSNSNFDEAEFVIFGIPYDRTQTFKPGSRFAPNSIREASWNLETYSIHFDYDLEMAKICDVGNVCTDGDFDDVAKGVRDLLSRIGDRTFVALGGEHTVSYMIMRSLKRRDLVYLVFDAHLDLRDEFDGTKFSHACNSRRVYELGFDVVIVGARSCCKEELEFARREGIKLFGPEASVESIKDVVGDRDLYLSVDVDVFDPSFAPGVSTPEPFGMNPKLMIDVYRELSERIVAADFVEVVPDQNGITQNLVAKLVMEFIASKASREPI